jgi:hypothetical protein
VGSKAASQSQAGIQRVAGLAAILGRTLVMAKAKSVRRSVSQPKADAHKFAVVTFNGFIEDNFDSVTPGLSYEKASEMADTFNELCADEPAAVVIRWDASISRKAWEAAKGGKGR